MKNKNIVVYCSSRENLPQEYRECAARLGEWIGGKGYTMVYGGVHAGLMCIAAQATHDNGGKVVGVIPEMFLYRRSELNDELIVTKDLNDRKSRMIELGDVYVVLPGGIGTLDEWVATLSHNLSAGIYKKLLIVNMNGVFDAQYKQLEDSASSPFAHGDIMGRMVVVSNADEMLEKIEELTESNIE